MRTLRQFIHQRCQGDVIRMKLSRGWIGQTYLPADHYDGCVPDGFRLIPGWSDDTFRRVWISDKDRTIITYLAGQLRVHQFTFTCGFWRALLKDGRFYGEPLDNYEIRYEDAYADAQDALAEMHRD